MFDYCLFRYQPCAPLDPGARVSEQFLLATVSHEKLREWFQSLIQSIKAAVGENRTVWGVKWIDGKLSWELYFYNWDDRETSRINNVQKAFSPFISYQVHDSVLSTNYFMHSIDVNEDVISAGTGSGIHVYYKPNNSYFCTSSGLVSENQYYFMRPREEMETIYDRILHSAYVDFDRVEVSSVLWPTYLNCFTVCRAHKQRCDGLYYSRVSLARLREFVDRFAYPASIREYIAKNESLLAPLLFDVGFDYVGQKNDIRFLKSGFYGYF